MIDGKYVDFAVEKTLALLAIDSPSGYTNEAAQACLAEFKAAVAAAITTITVE